MRWLETSAPGPPPRHSYRHERDWDYLARAARHPTPSVGVGMSHVSDKPATGVLDDLDLYTGIYRRMLLIRGFEDLVQSLFLAGEVYGTTHLYSGQEAIATGVASVLEERDRVAATYRGHGHALALGVDPQQLLDEMLGARVRRQRRARRLDERELARRPADRLVRDRRRQHRGGDGGGARAEADDGRRRRRVLRRRRDEPGLRLRVPQLLPGPRAAARLRLREQRLRRVHAVPLGDRGRDPRPRGGHGAYRPRRSTG